MSLARVVRPFFRTCSGVFAVSLILGGLYAVANADESSDDVSKSSFVKRPYVAIGVGPTHLKPRSPSPIALTIQDDNDVGFHVAIGYDFSRLLSAEVYAASLGSASVGFLGAPVGDVDYEVYGATAIAYLFNSRSGSFLSQSNGQGDVRREGLSLYGRFGIGVLTDDDGNVDTQRDHTSHAAFGLGLEYGFKNGFALRGEYIALDTDAQYLTATLVKRFGKLPPASTAKIALDKGPGADTAPAAVVDPVPARRPAVYDGPTLFRPIVPPYIYFDFGTADISDTSIAKLNSFVDEMNESELDVEIQGHTDWVGGQEFNLALSQRRAAAIRDYLASRGISSERLETRGFGESRPISSNSTVIGRSHNRRVEMHLK